MNCLPAWAMGTGGLWMAFFVRSTRDVAFLEVGWVTYVTQEAGLPMLRVHRALPSLSPGGPNSQGVVAWFSDLFNREFGAGFPGGSHFGGCCWSMYSPVAFGPGTGGLVECGCATTPGAGTRL